MSVVSGRRMLRVEDAALFLGVSASHLNKLRCWGGGPKFSKYGRRVVVYDPNDLEAWLAARKRTSTSDEGGNSSEGGAS